MIIIYTKSRNNEHEFRYHENETKFIDGIDYQFKIFSESYLEGKKVHIGDIGEYKELSYNPFCHEERLSLALKRDEYETYPAEHIVFYSEEEAKDFIEYDDDLLEAWERRE